MAVGSRSQSARTYLEKHLDEFLDCDTDELIKHGLRALRDTLPNEVELNTKVFSALCSFSYNEVLKVNLPYNALKKCWTSLRVFSTIVAFACLCQTLYIVLVARF